MFSLCPSPSSSSVSSSAGTVGKYCYSFTSYDDKAQKCHCGNSADETIMLTLSLWLTQPPTQQKLSQLWGRRRGRQYEGFSSSSSSLLFNIYSAFSGAAFRSRCLQMRRTKQFFVVRQMQKLKLQYPRTWPRVPHPLSLPPPAALKNFFALEYIYCGCQGKMPIEIEVWMSWMGKWATPYLLLSHFVNL